ncbi:MAG: response regulator transcription factor [Chloroflexi bacterium]|nr:response regulator transcription factor [Chloroflexota bacterium]
MKALIVDDDVDIGDMVALCFEIRWPEATVLVAQNGTKGIELFDDEHPDIVILDLGLPDIDGLEVCRRIRENSDVPIIILTVRDQKKDIVRGLEAGADDYITKPFNQMEFMARSQAVLRRTQNHLGNQRLSFENEQLVIDPDSREVRVQGELACLTPREYNLLYLLASNAGKPLSHVEILVKVWGQEYADAYDYLKTYVQHLRQKLGDNASAPVFIATERGIGYKFIAKSP